MMIVLKPGAEDKEIEQIVEKLDSIGAKAHISKGQFRTVIGAIGDRETIMGLPFEALDFVESVVPIMKPYKLVSLDFKQERTVINVGKTRIAEDTFTVIAGPCSVETEEQVIEAARISKEGGAHMFRGGAYKPRTSPYSFQGLGEEGLAMLAIAREETGLPIVTEILDVRDIPTVVRYADILQVGTRNMQNFLLLKELGQIGKPVLLKRGFSSTIEEWLMAAEYIAKEGNDRIILCERGIRTFETAVRNTLDLSAVPLARSLSHLPVIVDPSHATGKRDLIKPMSFAAMACGADGVMIEVHPRPSEALCDGQQSIKFDELKELMDGLRKLAEVMERKM